MTSSLVGSEMCIRDSEAAAGTASGAFDAVGLWCCVPRVLRHRGKWRCLSCLLYTSDAADICSV
eukprot:10895693-Prorocentrum_lima.AAC.1